MTNEIILDDLEATSTEFCSQGIKLSKIASDYKDSIDISRLLGKFQQLGVVRIVYNLKVNTEPLVKITEKGKQTLMELFEEL